MFNLHGLSDYLSADELRELNNALLSKWTDVFSVVEWDLGKTDLVKHQINMIDSQPSKRRHRRIPPAMYNEECQPYRTAKSLFD